MASLIIAALPVQTAATVLQAATNRSPIRAAYTAAVEDDWPLRHLLDVSFKWRSRRSFCRGTIGDQKKCTRRKLRPLHHVTCSMFSFGDKNLRTSSEKSSAY